MKVPFAIFAIYAQKNKILNDPETKRNKYM